jgi:SAM-dependent methyltransferase
MAAPGQWRHGALEAVPECPACGGRARAPRPWRTRDHLGGNDTDVWQLWRCRECASVLLDPRPDAASLPMAYGGYYTHAAAAEERAPRGLARSAWGLMNGYLRARFDWRREPVLAAGRWLCALLPPLSLKLDYLGRHLFARRFPQRGLLVDVGCGNGEFLAQAREMGWRTLGVEPDAQAVAACRARGLEVVEGDVHALLPAHAGRAEVVTLSHCIEHVPDPRQVLASVHGLLRPGGTVWIATPNPGGAGLRIFGSAWRGLEPSRHLCVPSQRALRGMLAEAGFEGIELPRRGEHGKTITRESAQVAGIEARAGRWWRRPLAWCGMPLRLFAGIAGSLSPRWAEETVILARSAPVRGPARLG